MKDTILKALCLEDSADDQLLVERALRTAGIVFTCRWVSSRRAFLDALASECPDFILADCSLPDIDAAATLEAAGRLAAGTPLIFVTGSLDDETAVALLRAGACDYVLKDRLARLGPAVQRGLERAHSQARQLADAARLQEALLGTIDAITRTVEKRDPYTAGHQQRVADLAVAIARDMGLEEDRIEGLRMGALMHDIGKISVPAEILTRPGKLTALEFQMIQGHPETGYDILKDVAFPWPVAQMILQHHERLDGTGYPRGLRGDEIILEARIISVADVLEAMMSHRPYRASLGLPAALAELQRLRGIAFDPRAVDACERVVGQWEAPRLAA